MRLWFSSRVLLACGVPGLATALLLLSPSLLWAHSHAPASTDPFLSYLPQDSQIVLRLSKIKAIKKALEGTSLSKLFDEAEFSRFLAEPEKASSGGFASQLVSMLASRVRLFKIPRLVKQLDRILQRQAGITFSELWDLFEGPHYAALTRIPLGSEPLQVALLLGLTDAPKARKFLDVVFSLLTVTLERFDEKGQAIVVLKGLEYHLYIAITKEALLITTTLPLMRGLLQNRAAFEAKTPAKSLAHDVSYQNFAKLTSAGPSASVYISMGPVLRTLLASFEPVLRRTLPWFDDAQGLILERLGLGMWQSAGLIVGIEGAEFVSRTHIALKPGPLRGLTHFFALKPIDPSLLAYAPTRPWAAFQVHLPLKALWQETLQILDTMPPQFRQSTRQRIEALERGILQRSIAETIGLFGEEVALFLSPFEGGLWPQFSFVLKPPQAKILRQTLERLLSLGSLRFNLLPYRGIDVLELGWLLEEEKKELLPRKVEGVLPPYVRPSKRRYRPGRSRSSYRGRYRQPRGFRSPRRTYPQPPPALLNAIPPAFRQFRLAFHNDRLLFASTPQGMWDLLDLILDPPSPKRVEALASFQASAKGQGLFLRIDDRPVFRFLYSTFLAALPTIQTLNPGLLGSIGYNLLPRTKIFLRHMAPTQVTLHTHADQIHTALRTRLGLEHLLSSELFIYLFEDVLLQHPVDRYLSELEQWQVLMRRSEEYRKKGLFVYAAERWRSLAEGSTMTTIISLAKKQLTSFEALIATRQKALQTELSKRYEKAVPGLWHLQGDWTSQEGELRALTNKQSSSTVTFGRETLSSYLLKFEVKDPGSFQVGLHSELLVEPHRSYPRSGHTLFFEKDSFQAGHWTPIQIKVRGNRISYWFGMRHNVYWASRTQGQISITALAESKMALRGLVIQPEGEDAKKALAPARPALSLSFQSQESILSEGSQGSYLVTLVNRGSASSASIQLRLAFPPSVDFGGIIESHGIQGTFEQMNRTLLFQPIARLQPQQSLTFRIRFVAKKAGSAQAQAFFRVGEQPAEVILDSFTHILPPQK